MKTYAVALVGADLHLRGNVKISDAPIIAEGEDVGIVGVESGAVHWSVKRRKAPG